LVLVLVLVQALPVSPPQLLTLDSGLWTLDPGHLWRYGSRSIDTACRDCGFGFKDSGLADSRASACRERTTTLDFELFLALRVGSIDTA